MNYLDLFSGIGGFGLGAYWAGMKFDRHYFSEVDPWAVELYQKRFPDAIPLGDIRAIKGEELPCGDWTITGGFPCQDLSYAGAGAGLSGERSGLWSEMRRVFGKLRPQCVVVENSAALLGRGLGTVLGDMAAVGLGAEWHCIPAAAIGARHIRDRVFIIGTDRKVDNPNREYSRGIRRQAEANGWWTADVAERPCLGRGTWTGEPGMARVAYGIPHGVDRLRGLGNAIVPQIAELIFTAIKEGGL